MTEVSAHHALAALREATQAQHQRIEQVLRLDETLTRPRYIAVLQGFHGFLGPWEARVRAALPERLHDWFDARRRAPMARADLDFLDAPAQPPDGPASEAARGLRLLGTADALGSLYVIEGSALGGQVLAPRLSQTLGVRAGAGGDYFHGHGARTGALWREFRLLLENELGRSPTAIDAATRAANATFGALIASFERLDEKECA